MLYQQSRNLGGNLSQVQSPRSNIFSWINRAGNISSFHVIYLAKNAPFLIRSTIITWDWLEAVRSSRIESLEFIIIFVYFYNSIHLSIINRLIYVNDIVFSLNVIFSTVTELEVVKNNYKQTQNNALYLFHIFILRIINLWNVNTKNYLHLLNTKTFTKCRHSKPSELKNNKLLYS